MASLRVKGTFQCLIRKFTNLAEVAIASLQYFTLNLLFEASYLPQHSFLIFWSDVLGQF